MTTTRNLNLTASARPALALQRQQDTNLQANRGLQISPRLRQQTADDTPAEPTAAGAAAGGSSPSALPATASGSEPSATSSEGTRSCLWCRYRRYIIAALAAVAVVAVILIVRKRRK